MGPVRKSAIFGVLLTITLVLTFQYAYAVSFGDRVQLSDTAEMSIDPSVGAEGKNVYVLWNDGCFIDENDNTVCNDVSFRQSADSGAMFGDTLHLRIDNDVGQSGGQTLAQSKQNVYASWVDSAEGNNEIFFAASNNRGESFNVATNLSENEGNSGIEPASMAAAGQDDVYVAWTDDTPGNLDILFRSSHDGGNSFGDTTNLSDNDGNSDIRDGIVVSGDDVYAVWQDETEGNLEIFFRVSHNGGESFDDTMNLSETGGQSFIPLMTGFEETVYVTWFEVSGPCNNLLRISHNGGESFGGPICLDDFGIFSVIEIAAVSEEKFYLLGFGQAGSVSDVLLLRSTDGGESFKVIDLDIELSINFEKAAMSGNRILFAWEDPQSGNEFLKVSTDGARTFSPAINITDEGIVGAFSGQSMEMVLEANRAYFVWSDNSTGNLEVYFGASELTK